MKEYLKEYGVHILTLPLETRKRMLSLEQERFSSGYDEEQFMADKLCRSNLELLLSPKKTTSPDGGVDFSVRFEGQVYIGQLKWWRRPLTLRQTKDIFGELYFSDIANIARRDGNGIRFLLLCPLINKKVSVQRSLFSEQGYSLLTGSEFVRFMSNPKYFFNHCLEAVR